MSEEDSDARENAIFMASLAEQAERYDEMVTYMKKISGMWLFLALISSQQWTLNYPSKKGISSRWRTKM